MFSRVIPELISLANASTMRNKHAAAIVGRKSVFAMATNYSLQG